MKTWQKDLLFALAVCIVAAFYGLERAQSVSFVCTNGDYQTYNALRRVLAGQVPYKDFANYLGMGPLLLCLPLVALHDTLAGSLFASYFVSIATFILMAAMIFYLITGNKLFSAFAGLLLPKLVSGSFFTLIPVYGYYTNYYLEMLMFPQNSFRVARAFLPVLLCALALLFLRRQNKSGSPYTLRRLAGSARSVAGIGFIVGICVTWSNDFGFACIGSATVILLILLVADVAQGRTPQHPGRAMVRQLALYFAALAVGAILSAFLASGGHLGSWLEYTRGVASWQFWYFGIDAADETYSVAQLFDWQGHHRTLLHWAVWAAAMAYSLYRLCKKRENDRLILLVFLSSSVIAAQIVYIVGTGYDNLPEVTYVLLIIAFWALLCKGALWLAARYRIEQLCTAGAGVLLGAYLAYCVVLDVGEGRALIALHSSTAENYVAALDGVTPDADALNEMAKIVGESVGGKSPVFSTYATGLEDMLDTFQPTGTDYIIHALGDTRYAKYLQTFQEGEYRWVQTTNYTVWPWEMCFTMPSWDFYRELFSDYRVHSEHSVWTLWEYAGEDANVLDVPVELTMVPLDEHEVELSVTSPEQRPCYVDVTVSWQNSYVWNAARLQTWSSSVFIWDPSLSGRRGGVGDGTFRPINGEKAHLFIFMENGYGTIRLSGQPANCTTLTVSEAEVGDVILFQR